MILQAIADGLLTGAILALGAIGLTLTFGILRFANFAHSELITWGAYAALIGVSLWGGGQTATFGPLSFGWPLIGAFILAVLVVCALALTLDKLLFAPLRQRASPITLVCLICLCILIVPISHWYTSA